MPGEPESPKDVHPSAAQPVIYSTAMSHLHRILIVLLCVAASACATRGKPLDAEAANQLYQRAHQTLQAGKYSAAIRSFNKLADGKPPAPFGEQAMIELTYGYYKKQDYAAATRTVGAFLQQYPEHPRADYMQYLRAAASLRSALRIDDTEVARRATALGEAYEYLQELAEQFPDSDYRENVVRDTAVVRQQLASVQLEQARAALRRGDLAGLTLARRVDDEFHETPAAQEALALISDPDAINRKPPPAATMTPPLTTRSPARPANAPSPRNVVAATAHDDVPEPRIPIHDPQWILQQNPERYTVELIAGASTETVQRFVDTHNLRGGARYPVGEQQARDALIHGLYPDAASARIAASQLMKRWGLREAPVRRLAEVQKKLHNEAAAPQP